MSSSPQTADRIRPARTYIPGFESNATVFLRPSLNQGQPQGALVLTLNNHPSQHANERKSSLIETFLINPLNKFEDWQQQGHSDTVGACEGTLSESGSSRNGILHHPPGLGLSSSPASASKLLVTRLLQIPLGKDAADEELGHQQPSLLHHHQLMRNH